MLDRHWLSRKLQAFPRRTIPQAGLRPAAVLVPLFNVDDRDHLLFTVRTAHLQHHAGEISFPGGGQDANDATLEATALRETEEELGIASEQVTLLGRLDDFYSIHGYHVVPFVGVIPLPEQLRIDRFEIDRVFSAPLAHFREPGVHHVEDWTHEGRDYLVDFYRYSEHVIWGLTGAILRQFLEVTIEQRS
jgi:8-oxo-dGTP pyrophosphatase MutT (NUDIX family)